MQNRCMYRLLHPKSIPSHQVFDEKIKPLEILDLKKAQSPVHQLLISVPKILQSSVKLSLISESYYCSR